MSALTSIVLGFDSPTPSPTPTDDSALGSPGWPGYVATAIFAILAILLIIDMTRRMRRVRYRAEAREKIAAELAADVAVEATDTDDQVVDAGDTADEAPPDDGASAKL